LSLVTRLNHTTDEYALFLFLAKLFLVLSWATTDLNLLNAKTTQANYYVVSLLFS